MRKILFLFIIFFAFNSFSQTTVCQGDTVVMIVDNPAGTIQWQKSSNKTNWFNIANATNDSLFIEANNNLYYRAIIYDTSCSLNYSYYSDTLSFTVSNYLPVNITVNVSPGSTITAGSTASFTAGIVNGGSSPYYMWYVNNALISGNNTQNYSNSTLLNGDSVKCKGYSNFPCVTGNPALSNAVHLTVLPGVSTAIPSSILATSAVCGGIISNDGGAAITARGVCWSTLQNPSITDSHTSDGSGTGSFSSNITGLTVNTTYYVRAYATSIAGTSYGNQVSFYTSTPCTSVTDIDGNVYNAVAIGTQCWMASNLKTSKYRNGTSISNVTSASSWAALTTGAYCYYNNSSSNNATYGKLYNYYAVVDSRNLCPTGWHVPSDTEWTTLTDFLGGETIAGAKLKETGTTHWALTTAQVDNSTGFTALPGGNRLPDGSFNNINDGGDWWSSTICVWYRGIDGYANYVYRGCYGEKSGFSVRCIKD